MPLQWGQINVVPVLDSAPPASRTCQTGAGAVMTWGKALSVPQTKYTFQGLDRKGKFKSPLAVNVVPLAIMSANGRTGSIPTNAAIAQQGICHLQGLITAGHCTA
jgi:hypothetical protein